MSKSSEESRKVSVATKSKTIVLKNTTPEFNLSVAKDLADSIKRSSSKGASQKTVDVSSLVSKSYSPSVNQLLTNFIKILISTIIMSFILLFSLDELSNYLDYSYDYKALYLISIVSFVGMFYLLSCYLFGILKLRNYKTY